MLLEAVAVWEQGSRAVCVVVAERARRESSVVSENERTRQEETALHLAPFNLEALLYNVGCDQHGALVNMRFHLHSSNTPSYVTNTMHWSLLHALDPLTSHKLPSSPCTRRRRPLRGWMSSLLPSLVCTVILNTSALCSITVVLLILTANLRCCC